MWWTLSRTASARCSTHPLLLPWTKAPVNRHIPLRPLLLPSTKAPIRRQLQVQHIALCIMLSHCIIAHDVMCMPCRRIRPHIITHIVSCTYIHTYACICTHVYIHIHTHTHTGAPRDAAATALVTDEAVGGADGDVAVATDDVIVLMSPRGSAHATVSATLGLSPAWSRDSPRCSYACM